MIKKRILAVLSIIFILLFFTSPQAGAAQPYMGGYLSNCRRPTNKVLLKVNFGETNASRIPGYKFLMGLTSVAGADWFTPSGWMYQNAITLYYDNSVWWAPQAWSQGDMKYHWYYRIYGDDAGDFEAFYEKTIINPGNNVNYTLFIYRTEEELKADSPYWTYVYNHPTQDSNFLVGTWPHNGKWVKFFQFGVESNFCVTETEWEVLNDKACYYDEYMSGPNWRYWGGRVCHGDTSYITWTGSQNWLVGGNKYSGVDALETHNDFVLWRWMGTTIEDNSYLWTGWGVVDDIVDRPYEWEL